MSRLSYVAVVGFSCLGLASAAVGQTTEGETVGEAPADASPVELLQYIEAESQPAAKPASREQQFQYHRKASWAKIRAANRLLKIGRQESHLAAALRAKRHYLGVLGQLGEKKCREQCDCFFSEMCQDENPAIASAARRLAAYDKLNNWRELGPNEKESVRSEAQALLEQSPGSLENVRLASNVANVAGNSGDEPLAIQLLDYMLPTLEGATDKQIQELAPKVEGLSRRLRLPGNPMELSGTTLGGGKLDWEGYRGKVVLVDFWATWCGPCIAELPNVRRCYEKYQAIGFEVVGVSLDESPEAVAQFLEQNKVPWATLCGDAAENSGWNHPMAVRYGIRRLPQAILVDADGRVVHMNAKGEQLESLLEGLLADPVAAAPPAEGKQSRDAVAQQ
ncbi:Thiol-disulfide oxidoreductase ResA [Posidoniimonas corsicana]|uniref:Thiol-disulfide oxidoreductase ResA n=1 Tax=Posidoniimonas corsicana TaxID=1938618 RepID=A0A5C5VIA1_9BACT|nr:TlpA disulfide reductase family protein [Posidoniimonas corsicana]TWT37412.1 Thiol-disulfide oxidoreductase ResA [Posidoniimonas corsicana]